MSQFHIEDCDDGTKVLVVTVRVPVKSTPLVLPELTLTPSLKKLSEADRRLLYVYAVQYRRYVSASEQLENLTTRAGSEIAITAGIPDLLTNMMKLHQEMCAGFDKFPEITEEASCPYKNTERLGDIIDLARGQLLALKETQPEDPDNALESCLGVLDEANSYRTGDRTRTSLPLTRILEELEARPTEFLRNLPVLKRAFDFLNICGYFIGQFEPHPLALEAAKG